MCFAFLFFIHSNQINIINSLRDELTTKYNIDTNTSLLRTVMTYETRIIIIVVINHSKIRISTLSSSDLSYFTCTYVH